MVRFEIKTTFVSNLSLLCISSSISSMSSLLILWAPNFIDSFFLYLFGNMFILSFFIIIILASKTCLSLTDTSQTPVYMSVYQFFLQKVQDLETQHHTRYYLYKLLFMVYNLPSLCLLVVYTALLSTEGHLSL